MSKGLEFSLVLSLVDKFTGPARDAAKAFRTVGDWARNLERNPPDYSATIRRLQGLQDVGDKLQAKGKEISIAGASTLYAGKQMADAISGMTSAANEYEYSVAMLATAVPGTFGSIEADINRVHNAATAWSSAHRDSANEYVKASLSMVSAGLATDQAIAGAGVALAVATATMGEGSAAAELLATVYNGVGDVTADLQTEMMRLGDVITKTQQFFQFKDMDQLTQGFKYALPASKQFRMELAETAAVIGQLNNAGITGSQAGTAFRASVFRMSDAAQKLGFDVAWAADGGLDFVGTLQNIQTKFGSKLDAPETQQALQEAFGVQAFTAVGTLLGQVDKLTVGVGQVRAGAGSTTAALATLDRTGTAAMARLSNATQNARIALGAALAPALLPIVQALSSIMSKVAAWAEANPGLASALGIVAIAVTTLTVVLGGMLTGVGMTIMAWGSLNSLFSAAGLQVLKLIPSILSMNAALWANPVVLIVAGIIAAIALLAVGIYLLIKHWDKVKAAASAAIAWISDGLAWVWTWIKKNWPLLLPLLLGPLAPLIYGILAIVKYWDKIKAAAAFALGWVLGKAMALWAWIKKNWPLLAPILLGPFAPLGYAVLAVIKHWDTIKTWIVEAVGSIMEFLQTLPDRVLEWAKRIGTALLEGITSKAGAAWDFITGAGRQLFEYFKPDATASGVAFADTFAAGVRAGSPQATAAVAGLTTDVDKYMPHSDAAVGPLSRLTDSGRAFGATFGQGVDDGAVTARSSVESLLSGLHVPDFDLTAVTTPAQRTRDSVESRRPSISIARLTINVSAQDVREAQDLGDLLQGLALEVG